MTQPGVAILIVTHNSAREITDCVNAAKVTGFPVIVIDNSSQDGTAAIVERLPATLIANISNRGFAAAVNQGVHATTAPLLLLLNPDATLLTPLDGLVKQCEQPGTAAAGGLLLSADGAPQAGFNVRAFPTPGSLVFENLLINRMFPNNPINWRYRCLGFDLQKAAEAEQPAGALLMFRRDAWEQIGGFDEGFFPLWFEDVDFCKRLRDANFRVAFSPATQARHTGAHSIAALPAKRRIEYWYGSLLRYSIRHFHRAGRIVICLSVVAGSLLRATLGDASNRSPDMLRAYAAVIRLAFFSLWREKVRFGEIIH